MNWKSSYKQSLKFSLRSNYKLPLSFILFFVLMFFLLGEQLPALPLYLGLPHGDSDKVHILDLSPGDGLHRPIAYLIIGIINWVMFGRLAWPLAYGIGLIIAITDQFFLTPPDHRPPANIFSALTISFAWAVFTLIPYFLFKWVDKKWGEIGIKKAILTLFLINLIIFGFFAFQIYVLHHSYRSLSHDQRNNCQPGNPNDGPDCPK